MNPKRFLTHIVRSQPRRNNKEELTQAFTEHVRKTLSRENLTKVVRERLAEQHRRKALRAQLEALQEQLRHIHDSHSERVRKLRARANAIASTLQKE